MATISFPCESGNAPRIALYEKRMAELSAAERGRLTDDSAFVNLCKGLVLCLRVAEDNADIYSGKREIEQRFRCCFTWAFGAKGDLSRAIWQFRVNRVILPGPETKSEWFALIDEMTDDLEKSINTLFHVPATVRFFPALRHLIFLLRIWKPTFSNGKMSIINIWAEIVEERLSDLRRAFEHYEDDLLDLQHKQNPVAVDDFVRRFRADNDRMCDRVLPLRTLDGGDDGSFDENEEAETVLSILNVEFYYTDKCNRMESVREGILHRNLWRYDYIMSYILNPDYSMIGAAVQIMAQRLAQLKHASIAAKRALEMAQREVLRFFNAVDETYPLPPENRAWHDVVDCVKSLFFFAENVADGEADTDAEPMANCLIAYHDRLVDYSSAIEKVARKTVRGQDPAVDSRIVERLEKIYEQGVQIQSDVKRLIPFCPEEKCEVKKKDAANWIGISERQLYNWEHGEGCPPDYPGRRFKAKFDMWLAGVYPQYGKAYIEAAKARYGRGSLGTRESYNENFKKHQDKITP